MYYEVFRSAIVRIRIKAFVQLLLHAYLRRKKYMGFLRKSFAKAVALESGRAEKAVAGHKDVMTMPRDLMESQFAQLVWRLKGGVQGGYCFTMGLAIF